MQQVHRSPRLCTVSALGVAYGSGVHHNLGMVTEGGRRRLGVESTLTTEIWYYKSKVQEAFQRS